MPGSVSIMIFFFFFIMGSGISKAVKRVLTDSVRCPNKPGNKDEKTEEPFSIQCNSERNFTSN